MKKKHTNKESSRLRPQGRAKSTVSIFAALMVMGATTAAMSTSFNKAPAGKEEVLEVSTCPTSDAYTDQLTTTVVSATTTSLTTTTLAKTSSSVSTTSMATQSSIETTVNMTTTSEVTTLMTMIPATTAATTIEIVEAEPVDVIATTYSISDAEYVWLCNLVGHEYGSDWVPVAEKAKVVAVVMNRVNSPKFPNDIWSVITAPYQFTGFSSYGTGGYTYQVTQSVKDAVDYYFANPDEFPNWLYFDGNHYASDGSGPYNYFYY